MIDELVKTVRLHLSEKLTSPLLGAFAVSWCVWNHRAIIVVLSGEPVEKKFELLDRVVYPSLDQSLMTGLVYPLLTSLAYLFLYPYPAKFVYEYTRMKQREMLDIRRRIEEETPLTVEDSRRIRSELARARIEHFSELDRKDTEIERLKTVQSALEEQVQSLMQQLSEKQIEPTNAGTPLSENQLMLLQLIGDSEVGSPRGELKGRSGLSRVDLDFALGELVNRELIKELQNPDTGEWGYDLTHKGLAAVAAARANNKSEAGTQNVSLSKEAAALMRAASDHGQVQKRIFLSGKFIEAGGVHFGETSPREFAKWDRALSELIRADLVRDSGSNGETFQFTDVGWQIADALVK